MTEAKDLDEFEPQPGFQIFGWVTTNSNDYKDPQPIKWLTGEKFIIELDIKFNEHAQVKRWCEQNCKDMVAYEISRPGFDLRDKIYFFLEEDAVAFKLRWL